MNGAVAAGTEPAAEIGAKMLGLGGNAVDAAAAVALAMAVADPANASVAGRCHVLIAFPDGTAAALDGRTALPRAFATDSTPPVPSGPRVVSVPGIPRTLEAAIARFGRFSWSELCRPAATLAQTGFAIPRCLGAAWAAAAPGLRTDEGARRLFLRDDMAPAERSIFAQPYLATTLDDLASKGADAIMCGARARRIVALLRERGSVMTEGDLAEYEPLEGEVVRCAYRGWTVLTIGRQGYGYTLAQVLGIMSRFDLAGMDEPERWLTMLLAQRLGRQDRPGREEPAEHLLAAALLDERAGRLRELVAAGLQAVLACFGAPPPPPDERRGDTTHISAVDASGLACAITVSIGPHFGSLVAAPEDGYLFAHSYRMAEGDRAARRDRTEMLPTILLGPAGQRIAVGAAGSSRIPGAVLRAIVEIVDLGGTPADAVSAPAAVWHDGRVAANPKLGDAVLARLESAGLPVDRFVPRPGQHFGLLHLAAIGADGELAGAADPYWDGAARVNAAGKVQAAAS